MFRNVYANVVEVVRKFVSDCIGPLSIPKQTQGIIITDTESAIGKHRLRVKNLETEALSILRNIKELNNDPCATKSDREDKTTKYMKRLIIIRDELEIRTEVLNGFNS